MLVYDDRIQTIHAGACDNGVEIRPEGKDGDDDQPRKGIISI